MRAPTRTIQAAQFQPKKDFFSKYVFRLYFLDASQHTDILEDGWDGRLGVLEVVREDECHHGAQAEVGEEDDGQREDDRHRHHLLWVDHLLPHGCDHVEAHEPIEGASGAVDDPIHPIWEKSSVPAPTVGWIFTIASVRLNNFVIKHKIKDTR